MTFDRLAAFAQLHPLACLGLAALTVAILYNEVARRLTGYKSLTPAQLTTLVNREDALVLDVSAAADFDKGRIAGAKSLPMAQFNPEHKLLGKAKDRPVALVCRTGQGSAEAAAKLVKAGWTRVHLLEGGIPSWQQAELPLVKGRG
jgi:rhodanese-related sulfurtransferase